MRSLKIGLLNKGGLNKIYRSNLVFFNKLIVLAIQKISTKNLEKAFSQRNFSLASTSVKKEFAWFLRFLSSENSFFLKGEAK